jgi:multidrug efflux pump subunit AcrA (membrane-fusion protein)
MREALNAFLNCDLSLIQEGRLRFIPFNTFWKLSPFLVALLLMVGLFIPMGWGAPSGPAAVVRNSVQIIPSVAGEVVDVPVLPNTSVKEGDILFRIDPTTYAAQVDTIEAQLKFAELRLSQMSELQRRDSGRAFDVQQRQEEVDQARAQLEAAKWNLDKTIVRAPADGYVTNLALRKGARVTAHSPVMAFIDIVGHDLRCRNPAGLCPLHRAWSAGRGDVQDLSRTGLQRPGRDRAAGDRDRADGRRWYGRRASRGPGGAARDPHQARRPGCGAAAASRQHRVAAIYTDRVKAAHVIRKVVLRQTAIVNYVNPF